jgi:hypothetical protein
MAQKFIAREKFEFSNGAIGWHPGGPFDCLGPYAKVNNCPIEIDGKEVARLTCYASGYADTWFSVPATTRKNGKHISGYFTSDDGGVKFMVHNKYKHIFQ